VTPQGAIARITAPAIDLNRVVVDGVTEADLRKGPGWMPGTAPIGEAGNTVISGHRTTYGAPFRHLDRLKAGDRITLETVGGTTAVYEVRDSFVVKPGDVWVAEATPGARLTLTTCHPVGSDRERLVVQAEMVDGPAAAAATPASAWARSTP
jgi:sortase A